MQHLAAAAAAQNTGGGASLLSPYSAGGGAKGPRAARAHSASGLHLGLGFLPKNKDRDRPPSALSAGLASATSLGAGLGGGLGTAPPSPAGEHPPRAPFRRTYSSSSMKTGKVEVSAASFQKVKLLGRGDVGKVYLVQEKKTGKLFAMKGGCFPSISR